MSHRYSSQSSSSSGNRVALESIENGPPMRIWFSFMYYGHHEIDAYLRNLAVNTPGLCRYHNTKKYWLVEFSQLDALLAFTSNLQDFKLEEIPNFLLCGLKAYRDKLHRIYANGSNDIELNIEPILLESLLPFQVEGIRFAVARGGKALIGDEMGCGKTLQAIGLLQHYRNSWPALIIIPPTLITQWQAELTKHCEGLLKPDDICIMRKQTDTMYGRVCIIPYSMFDTLVAKKKISKEQFGVVIADESHRIKSRDTEVTKAVVPFLKHAEVSICLSGTPALNRPVELFTQVNALLPQVFNNYDSFVKRYCNAKPSKFNANILDVKGSSNEQELKCLLEGLVMIRRLKSDVLTLPDKLRKVVYVDIDEDKVNEIKGVQRQLNHLEQQCDLAVDPDIKMRLSKEKESLLTQYYKVTGLAKINGIKKNIMYYIREARKAATGDRLEEEDKQRQLALSEIEIVDIDKPSTRSKATEPVIMELEDDVIILDDDYRPPTSHPRTISRESELVDEEAEVLYDTDDEQPSKKKLRKSAHQSPYYSPSKRLRKKTHVDNAGEDGSDEESKSSIIDLLDDIDREQDFDENRNKAPRNLDSFVVRTAGKKKSTKVTPPSEEEEEDHLPLGKKILVFAHHKAVLDAIELLLKEQCIRFIRVDGTTTSARKGEYLKKFQTDPTVDVALLSITSCGVGLNLTVANLAIFAELYWTPGIVLQAEDRIHRFGQQSESVRIVYLLAKESADELVWEVIQRKCFTLEATIGTGEKSGRLQHTVTSNDAMGKSNPAVAPRGSQNATSGSSRSQQQMAMDQFLTQQPSAPSSSNHRTEDFHQPYVQIFVPEQLALSSSSTNHPAFTQFQPYGGQPSTKPVPVNRLHEHNQAQGYLHEGNDKEANYHSNSYASATSSAQSHEGLVSHYMNQRTHMPCATGREGSTALSAEQLAAIEEKRLAALAKLEAKKKAEMLQHQQQQLPPPPPLYKKITQTALLTQQHTGASTLPLSGNVPHCPSAPQPPHTTLNTVNPNSSVTAGNIGVFHPPVIQHHVNTGDLTAEQYAKAEANRMAALARLEMKKLQQHAHPVPSSMLFR